MKKIQIEKKYQSLMELWIEDLEANGALQGKEFLYNPYEKNFCCLGRLSVIIDVELDDISCEAYIEPNFKVPSILVSNEPLAFFLSNLNDSVSSVASKSIELQQLFKEDYDFDLEFDKQYTFAEIANFLKERLEYV